MGQDAAGTGGLIGVEDQPTAIVDGQRDRSPVPAARETTSGSIPLQQLGWADRGPGWARRNRPAQGHGMTGQERAGRIELDVRHRGLTGKIARGVPVGKSQRVIPFAQDAAR